MRKKLLKPIVFSTILSLSAANAVDYDFTFGVGLTGSGDYTDTVKKAYPGYSWSKEGKNFGEVYIGMPISFEKYENIKVIPRLSYLLGFMEISDWNGKDKYTNSIFLPAVAGRYEFSQTYPFYVEGEVNYSFARSGKDSLYDFDGGFGFGVFAGYTYKGFSFADINAEIGYRYLPIDVEYKNTGKTDNNNFGSFLFRIGLTF